MALSGRHRWLRWLLRALLGIVVLVLLVPVALYIPPIQQWAVQLAAREASKATGMDITVGRLRLRWPLRVQVDDATARGADGDTLMAARRAAVDVRLLPLLHGNVDIRQLELDDALYTLANPDTMHLWARIRRARLEPSQIRLATDSLPMLIEVSTLELDGVRYAMRLNGIIDSLGATIPRALLERAHLDFGAQTIHAGLLEVDSLEAAYLYPAIPSPPQSPPDTLPSRPWSITADAVRLTARHALYAQTGAVPRPGLDMQYLEVRNVDIQVDTFYNRATALRVPLRHLTATERCGLSLTASGTYSMDSVAMRAQGFSIAAPASHLAFDAMLGAGNLAADPTLPFALRAKGTLAAADLLLAYPDMRPTLAPLPKPAYLDVDIDVQGTPAEVAVRRLSLSRPGMLALQASGTVRNVLDPKSIAGRINLDGTLVDGTHTVLPLLDADMQRTLALPRRLAVKGDVTYAPGNVSGNLRVTADDGTLKLEGRWVQRAEQYEATLDARQFPVEAFMPSLGIANLTATLHARGVGYNPLRPRSRATVDVDLVSVTYRREPLRGITLQARVGDGHARGTLASANPAANLDLDFVAAVADTAVSWRLHGDIVRLDLQALGLTDSLVAGSLTLASQGRYNPVARTLRGTLTLDSVDVTTPDLLVRTGLTDLHAAFTDSTMQARLTNGDLVAGLYADCGLDTLLARITQTTALVDSVTEHMRLDVPALQHALPPLSVDMQAGPNNLLSQILGERGTYFRNAAVTLATAPQISLSGRVLGYQSGKTLVDTLTVTAQQRGPFLTYALLMGNRPGTLDDFAHVTANGFIGGNRLTAMLRQNNIEGATGFSLGLQAGIADSVATLRLMPYTPVIAYRDWRINPDNYVSYDLATHRLEADLTVTDSLSRLHFYTQPSRIDTLSNDVLLDMDNIKLQDWLAVSPFAPPLRGDLSAALRFHLNPRRLAGQGTVTLADFMYGRRRVGTFALDLRVMNNAATGVSRAVASLDVDSVRALSLRGVLNDSTARAPFLLTLNVDSLPLDVANPFLPPQMAQLQGALNGRMDVTGTMLHPRLDGWLGFDNTAVRVGMLNQAFAFAPVKIAVDSNVVHFNRFSVTAANDNPLTMDGTVDLNNLMRPSLNLTLRAEDMQVVNSNRARNGADIFGKAYVDLDATVRGNTQLLRVDADVALRGGTNVTYIIPGGTDAVTQMASGNDDVVHFVSFADSLQVQSADSLARSMAMLLDTRLDLRPGSTINVYLDAAGQNRVQLQPQGELDYTLTPLDPEGRLTGRVTIDKGYVRYTPPLLSEKYFTFEEGSSVAFNGEMMNPILNIHAVDVVKANVTQEGQNSRLVDFDVSLSVTNTLDNMDVAFDLSTNDDITVQNELQGMTPEQRASQAMNLLLYNVYTGPGTKGNASLTGNPLFSLLESRVNSWIAETVPGVDISLGINQYDRTMDGVTSQTMSYSYQVSKTLFDDRFKIVVGGNYDTDANADENFSQNLISNISFEYMLNRQGTMYIRIFRHTGYESVLEGEITQTGVGFVFRRKLNRLRDIFRRPKTITTPSKR